jgi:hypothetical protein
MTHEESTKHTLDLLAWMEERDIDLSDAIPILGVAIASIIKTIAKGNKKREAEGYKVVGDCIAKVGHAMTKPKMQ